MRLLRQCLLTMLSEYDEAILNQKFNPFHIYQAITLSSILTGQPIKDIQHKNHLYQKLIIAKIKQDTANIMKISNQLKVYISQDKQIISKFLTTTENTQMEYPTTNLWKPGIIGVLSHVEDE